MKKTFIEFLLNEDVNTEIAQLRSQVDALDMKKSKMDDMFNKQKIRLQQIIASKQRQAANQKQSVA